MSPGLQKPFSPPKKAFNGVISNAQAVVNRKLIAFFIAHRRIKGLPTVPEINF